MCNFNIITRYIVCTLYKYIVYLYKGTDMVFSYRLKMNNNNIIITVQNYYYYCFNNVLYGARGSEKW